MSEAKITEREWTDQFGTHYEVRGRSGERLASQKITRSPQTGWPKERELARGNVEASLAAQSPVHAVPKPGEQP